MALGDKYYLDKRATGANNGDLNGGVPDANGIVQDAYQSIADVVMPTSGIFELVVVEGSSSINDPYPNLAPWSGDGNDKTLSVNGNFISGGVDLNSSTYKWTQSTANPNAYYLELPGGGDPSLVKPNAATINGQFQESSSTAGQGAEELQYQIADGSNPFSNIDPSTLADERLGWGDIDTLGYSTIYARYDGGLSTVNIYASQITYNIDSNFVNMTINDAVFMYANQSNVRHRAASGTHTHNRCVYLYCGNASGVENQAANDVVINSGISMFAGHRAYTATVATSGLFTLNNCIDVNSHLFAWMNGSYASTFTIQNCIAYNQSAGFIDTNANTLGTFVENNNLFYPTFNGAGALEYPDGTDNTWTTTSATSLPPSLDTDTSTRAAIDAAMVTAGYTSGDPQFTNIDLKDFTACDFSLKSNSPCVGNGAKWWGNTPNPAGQDGEPFSDIDTDMGATQSTLGPFHPVNL
jgi:hypothetical protein